MTTPWTPDRIRALGVITGLVTAGQILGISRNLAYHQARTGTFPTPVHQVGRTYRVHISDLLTHLGYPLEPSGLDDHTTRSVDTPLATIIDRKGPT